MVDKTLEQVENKNDVGENFHRDLPFYNRVQRIAASNRPEHSVFFAACRGGADAGVIGDKAVCIGSVSYSRDPIPSSIQSSHLVI